MVELDSLEEMRYFYCENCSASRPYRIYYFNGKVSVGRLVPYDLQDIVCIDCNYVGITFHQEGARRD